MTAINSTLTQKEVKRLFYYDSNSGELTRLIDMGRLAKTGDIAGSKTETPWTSYLFVSIKNKSYAVHRIIWFYMTGEWPDQIDHIDGNGLNNKWDNLRNVDCKENSRNQKIRKTNTSGVMGVYWNKQNQKWNPRIRVDDQLKHLGYYSDFNDAVAARKNAEVKYGFHPLHGTDKLANNQA